MADMRRYTTIMVLDKQKLYEARIERGYQQNQLARKVGISPQYLNDIEAGRRVGTPDVRRRIAKALKVRLRDICEVN